MPTIATSSEAARGTSIWPAQPDPAAAPLVASVLVPLLAIMRDTAPVAGGTLTPRALHRYRVAMRRSRSLLSAFKPLFGKAARRRFRADFAWLNQGTGRLRDLDVLLAELGSAPHPAELPAPAVAFIRARRDEEHWRVLRLFGSARYADFLRDWTQALGVLAAIPPSLDLDAVDAVVERALARQYARACRHLARWRAVPDYAHLHRVRKELKRLRYLAESIPQHWSESDYERIRADCKDLQDLLGAVCDRHAQVAMLRAWLASPLVAADATLSAALHELAERREDPPPARRALARKLEHLRSPDTRARFLGQRQAAPA